ncbi:tyrosine decarboxylase MfnA [Halobacteriales archaeon QS_8_69_26]|nr:MAG: tyrosine decarboxylase MfnA [Halobacteriales archaeon QS_8_69_26]
MDESPQSFDRVLSSMCTPPHPVAREAAERFLATNPGDPASFPSVARLEERAVDTLGEVAGLDDPAGYVASGGTEANLQAVRIAREHGRNDANVVIPESAHFSFRKAADLLGVELRVAPTDADGRANLDAVAELVDADTAGVVAVAGTTEYGRVDPVPALADLAADAGALLHVDAAWGGFELPFTDHAWNFADAAVDTMTVDPHKLGRAAIPAGGLLAREESLLESLTVDTPYLESRTQVTLPGTRSGAGVASAAAVLDELWPDGYRDQRRRIRDTAGWLADELDRRGYDVVDPELSIVAFDVDTRVFEALRDEGWRVARTGDGELRIVCGPHVTRDVLGEFLDDLDRRAADVGTGHRANPGAGSR